MEANGLLLAYPDVRSNLAPSVGLEPTTFRSVGGCSIQLSYKGMTHIPEPFTSAPGGTRTHDTLIKSQVL